jgi:hypothetical protein
LTIKEIIIKKGYYYTIHYITKQERLQYYVPLYRIVDSNSFIEIYDKKNKCFRKLPISNCEIEVKKSTMTEEEELQNTKFYSDKYNEYENINSFLEVDEE